MFESAQKKVWNLYVCPFKPNLGSQDTEVSPCKTHKKCVSENVNGTENPFPTQTAISAYAMSRVLKEGRKKMFFCSLGLGFGPFNFPQFPSKVHQFRRGFHQIQWIIPDAGSLNRSKSIGFKGNFAGNREIQCDFFVFRNCSPGLAPSSFLCIRPCGFPMGFQTRSAKSVATANVASYWGQLVESKSNIQCW